MSKSLQKSYHHLGLLSETKSVNLFKAIVREGDSNLIRALCEVAHNLVRGEEGLLQLTPRQKKFLEKNQDIIAKLANKSVSVKQKKKIVLRAGPVFLRQLIVPVLAVISSLIKQK